MRKQGGINRKGFTLVELTVVILIIGIIATIAAPRFFDSLDTAQENAAVSSLATIRNAIQLYKANNPSYPGTDAASFKAAIEPLLQNGFPKCPVGARADTVRVTTSGDPLTASGTEAWCYDTKTGEFRINHADYISY